MRCRLFTTLGFGIAVAAGLVLGAGPARADGFRFTFDNRSPVAVDVRFGAQVLTVQSGTKESYTHTGTTLVPSWNISSGPMTMEFCIFSVSYLMLAGTTPTGCVYSSTVSQGIERSCTRTRDTCADYEFRID